MATNPSHHLSQSEQAKLTNERKGKNMSQPPQKQIIIIIINKKNKVRIQFMILEEKYNDLGFL